MPEFRIMASPSRRLSSDKVSYHIKDIHTEKQVAKFSTDSLDTKKIQGWEEFNGAQKLELQNYIANVRFTVEKLKLPARFNRDYRLSLPEPLQNALITLFNQAQAHNIHFDPMSAMLNGLLNHITTTEKRLKKVGEESALQMHHIYDASEDKVELTKALRRQTRKIFKRLLKHKNNLNLYAKIAKNLYHKETNLSLTTLTNYAEGKTKPSQWAVSCALMVLGKCNDLEGMLSLPDLVALWLTPLKFSGKLNHTTQAVRLFESTFKMPRAEFQHAIKLISHEMNQAT